MMRDYSNGRADRVLMAVAATFLTMSVGVALAQSDQARNPADLAIDAAIPMPEPANVPPPPVNDLKADSTASISEPAKTAAAPAGDAVKDEPATAAPAPAAATAT